MSIDWYLYSPSRNRAAQCGSMGFGGTQSYPAHPDVIAFVRWAIDELLSDVVMVTEDKLPDNCDDEWPATQQERDM